MTVQIPGKVLVIDNKYKDVEEIITSLWHRGHGIVFLDTVPPEESIPSNVRLVILDLMLREDGEIQQEDYEQAALILHRISKRTSFFMVAIWSIHVDPEDEVHTNEITEVLKRAYTDVSEEAFPAALLKPFGKRIGQQQLEDEIQRWIASNPEAGLVFRWESSVDSARDKTLSEIVNQAGIRETVKQLVKEVGTEAAPREILRLFNRILGRNSISQTEADQQALATLVQAVTQMTSIPGNLIEWYSKFYNFQVYFTPHTNEPVWTGDIFYTGMEDPEKEFALILTPACDLAQRKTENLRIVYCAKVLPLNQYDPQSEEVATAVRKLRKHSTGNYKRREDVVQAIIQGRGLPSNLHVLYFFKMVDESEYFHLIVDFSMTASRACRNGLVTVPTKWKRVARIDSPFIEDLLQKYAAFASRIGIPGLPPNVISQEKTRMMPTN